MSTIVLSKDLTNEKVHRLVGKACKLLTNTCSKVGSEINFISSGSNITTKLWGFNNSRDALVVEVIINKTVLDKVEVIQQGDNYVHRYNPKFNYLYRYKLATGQNVVR